MHILVKCPKCDAGLPVAATDPTASIACGRCGREIPLAMSDALRADTGVDRCPVCAGEDFYLRKDFDPKMGVATVSIAVAISRVAPFCREDRANSWAATDRSPSCPVVLAASVQSASSALAAGTSPAISIAIASRASPARRG